MKRVKLKNTNWKIIFRVLRAIIIALIIYIVISLINLFKLENSIPMVEGEPFNIKKIVKVAPAPIVETEVNTLLDVDSYFKIEEEEPVEIATSYKGYEVCAELQIPAIDLQTCILDNYTEAKMDVCPTKYRGPEPNEVGNFCIVGHNYKNMFIDLVKLEIGDEIYLLDNKNGKRRYTIYNIYKVKPTNTECLNQETDGERIITLISCVNYADLRIIIKATED